MAMIEIYTKQWLFTIDWVESSYIKGAPVSSILYCVGVSAKNTK